MTPLGLANLVRYKTRTTTATLSDADLLVLANTFRDEMSSLVVERNNGMFLVPFTFDLVGDQREYALGDDILNRIQKVEIKFDSTTSRFPAIGIKDYYGSETESEIVKEFSNSQDRFAYTIRRRALFVLSGTIVAVTDGVRVWAHVYPASLANVTDNSTGMESDPTTTTFGFPRQLHELLARRISIEYKGRQPKPLPLSPMEKNYEFDLQRQLDAIAHIDNSGEIIAELPNPHFAGNDGWDY